MSMVVLSRVGGNQQSVLSRGPLPSHFSPHGGVGGLQLDIGSQPASYMGKEGRAVWSCGGHGWSQVVTELVFVAAGSWWRGCSGPCRVWLSLALGRFRDNGTHTCRVLALLSSACDRPCCMREGPGENPDPRQVPSPTRSNKPWAGWPGSPSEPGPPRQPPQVHTALPGDTGSHRNSEQDTLDGKTSPAASLGSEGAPEMPSAPTSAFHPLGSPAAGVPLTLHPRGP